MTTISAGVIGNKSSTIYLRLKVEGPFLLAELEGRLARAVERTVSDSAILWTDGRDLDLRKGRPRSAVGQEGLFRPFYKDHALVSTPPRV